MKTKIKNLIIWIVVGGILALGAYWLMVSSDQPGELDEFAMCLEEKGAVFYGTFWCPYCQSQKAMFGNSARLLPYIECSTPDGKAQLEICNGKGITGYPTWEFADGSRLGGRISLDTLSEKTGCQLPS